MKPVISVTHVTIYPAGTDVRRGSTFIASKQIYASHYFDASLALTMVTPACLEDECGVYLTYVNRSRTDLGSGLMGTMARSIIQRRLSDGMEDTLADLKERLESDWRPTAR